MIFSMRLVVVTLPTNSFPSSTGIWSTPSLFIKRIASPMVDFFVTVKSMFFPFLRPIISRAVSNVRSSKSHGLSSTCHCILYEVARAMIGQENHHRIVFFQMLTRILQRTMHRRATAPTYKQSFFAGEPACHDAPSLSVTLMKVSITSKFTFFGKISSPKPSVR